MAQIDVPWRVLARTDRDREAWTTMLRASAELVQDVDGASVLD